MFGFSLTKILFTVAVIAAVWYGFKWVGRMNDQRDRAEDARVKARPTQEDGGGPKDAIEDIVACPTCGDFVPAQGARACGRDNCPYPG